jgi:hypothetical protein
VLCWIGIPRAENGWGQIGLTMFFTPIAAIGGAAVGASVSAMLRARDPRPHDRPVIFWLAVFCGLAVVDFVGGMAVSWTLMLTFAKGGC